MIINNVKLVLENEVVHGSLEMQDGKIRAFAESQSHLSEAMDGEGGWLLPGLIELHTDNLDKFFTPRPKVDWPAHSAMSSHDALMVASGITTVLDAVAIGDVRDGGDRLENLEKMIKASASSPTAKNIVNIIRANTRSPMRRCNSTKRSNWRSPHAGHSRIANPSPQCAARDTLRSPATMTPRTPT